MITCKDFYKYSNTFASYRKKRQRSRDCVENDRCDVFISVKFTKSTRRINGSDR